MSSLVQNKFLSEIEGIVEDNLQNEHFGVEELAEGISMSRSHLHRKLKKETGQSISQFIREYRLRKALSLLLENKLTAAEIAYQVGFSSATYFSKVFHEFYGFTPGEARNKPKELVIEPENKGSKPKNIIFKIAGIALIIVIVALVLFIITGEKEGAGISSTKSKSIAVLPFKNISSDQDNQYFADGVMEAILSKLAKVHDLKVISRTSVEQYRNSGKSIPEIANELGVTHILEGSAQKYGRNIRITAQLINASTDVHIWSNDYTRKFNDVLYLQSNIAQSIVNELEAELTKKEKNSLEELPTKNTEAYNYYLQGDFQLERWNEEGLKKAIPLFEKAISLDSNFVEPYVGLATVYETGGAVWGVLDQTEAWQKSKTLLLKALKLDKNNANIHNMLESIYFYYEWDIKNAMKHQERCKEISGQYGDFAMDFLIKIGAPQEALEVSEHYIENDPANSIIYAFHAEALYFLGKKQKAIETLDKAYGLYNDFFLLREAAKLYFLYGEMEQSYHALKKVKRIYPDRPPIFLWLEAVHAHHREENPSKYLDELEARFQNNDSGSPAWFLALYYAEIGDKKALFNWLEKSYDNREVEMTWLKMEPALELYKDDPRYLDLLDRMGYPEDPL